MWPHQPQTREHYKALTQLAKWAYRFSPVIAFDAPPCTEPSTSSGQASSGRPSTGSGRPSTGSGRPSTGSGQAEDKRYVGLNLDLTGTERLFNHEALLERFVAYFTSQNLIVRIAIAPTLGAAWAFSRYGLAQTTTVTSETLANSLAPLPIRALRISTITARALKELHITHIKHLLKIPRPSLHSRFAPELAEFLDYALGNKQEPLAPLSFQPTLKAVKTFDSFVTQPEAVSLTVQMLLKQLLNQLQSRHEKAARLVFKIKANGLPLNTKILTLSVPSAKEKHLWALLQPHLESLQLGHGVEALGLAIARAAPIHAKKQSYLEEHDITEDTHYGELVDTCVQHLGEQNVLQVQPRASYIPERSYRYVLPAQKQPKTESPLLTVERPSLLFYQPQPIRALALLPDQPPFWIKWQGKKFSIQKSFGPERIAPEWWGRDELLCLTRDYFRVQLPTGLWLWVFRELETSRWFVHGVWA